MLCTSVPVKPSACATRRNTWMFLFVCPRRELLVTVEDQREESYHVVTQRQNLTLCKYLWMTCQPQASLVYFLVLFFLFGWLFVYRFDGLFLFCIGTVKSCLPNGCNKMKTKKNKKIDKTNKQLQLTTTACVPMCHKRHESPYSLQAQAEDDQDTVYVCTVWQPAKSALSAVWKLQQPPSTHNLRY